MVKFANACFSRAGLRGERKTRARTSPRVQRNSLQSAKALRPDDALATIWLMARMLFVTKRQWGLSDPSRSEAAITLDPNNAMRACGRGLLAWRMFRPQSSEGSRGVETAFRLSPREPSVPTGSSMVQYKPRLALIMSASDTNARKVGFADKADFPSLYAAFASTPGPVTTRSAKAVANADQGRDQDFDRDGGLFAQN